MIRFVFGGAFFGLMAATIYAAGLTVYLLLAYGREPGNDPLFPMALFWVFFLAPGGLTAGGLIGGCIRIALVFWEWFASRSEGGWHE